MEVVLIAQNLSCRYKDTLSNYGTLGDRDDRCTGPENQSTTGDWQLSIKLAGARSRRPYRNGTAYEALTVQGDKVFFGAVSSNARTSTGALLEAVIEARLETKDQGLVWWVSSNSHFKQHYTHFHTLFHPYVFQKSSKNFQTTLPNIP